MGYITIDNIDSVMKEMQEDSFYIPKVLFKDKKYKKISVDSKILYGLLLDRQIQIKKEFNDPIINKIYFSYALNEIANDLGCSCNKALKLLNELLSVDLVEKQKQTIGKPAMLYVNELGLEGIEI
ncbi:MAG: replication initiator protein A [Firmicutes bacterium]|nr:replication initiator protein A [Bacillota bacterium]